MTKTIRLICILLVVTATAGCRTTETMVSDTSLDSSRDSSRLVSLHEMESLDGRISKLLNRDSVVVRDSVFVMVKGDTVVREVYRDRYVLQRSAKADTVYSLRTETRTDTVFSDRWRDRVVTKTEVREKQPSVWDRTLRVLGWLALAAGAVAAAAIGLRRLKK